MPIGLIGSLSICTIFYMLVAAGVIGSVGAQPVSGPAGEALNPGSVELAHACADIQEAAVGCSKEALAWTLREIGWTQIGNLRSEEHTTELQSLMRISYAVFCLKTKH